MLRPESNPGPIRTALPVVGLLGFLLIFGQGPPDPATLAGFDPARLARIDEALEQAVTDGQLPGGVVLVYGRDREAYLATAGYHDPAGRRPVERSTLFRIASMTKPITALGAMILVDDGKLGLDEPISRLLPEFASMTLVRTGQPATRPITVRHLLNHTSGLSYRLADSALTPAYVEAAVSDGLSETPGTMADNVRRLARLPLLCEPGTAWNYSLSSDVLGRVIEVASGQTLDQFFRDRIFRPLRMRDTHFLVPPAKRDRLTTLFTVGPDGKVIPYPPGPIQQGALVVSGTFSTWDTGRYHSGGAGLVSTVDDYARFVRLLLNGGELDGVRLLRRELATAITSDQCAQTPLPNAVFGDSYGFGLGVVTSARRTGKRAGPGSFGWGGIFHTTFWADPDPKHPLFYVFLSNVHPNGHLTPLRETIERAVYRARTR